jgi:hypothetical protein
MVVAISTIARVAAIAVTDRSSIEILEVPDHKSGTFLFQQVKRSTADTAKPDADPDNSNGSSFRPPEYAQTCRKRWHFALWWAHFPGF